LINNSRLEKLLPELFKNAINSMEKENNGHINIGKLLEIKKKIRSVLGDSFFAKFELKEPFLFRLGTY